MWTIEERDRELRLVLPWPPSVNSAWRVISTARGSRVVLGADHRKYRREIVRIVSRCAPELETQRGDLQMVIHCRGPRRNGYDLDNRVKPLQDALEHAGVLENDRQVADLRVIRKPKSGTPHVQVWLRPCSDGGRTLWD